MNQGNFFFTYLARHKVNKAGEIIGAGFTIARQYLRYFGNETKLIFTSYTLLSPILAKDQLLPKWFF